jgi:hypothetical protein
MYSCLSGKPPPPAVERISKDELESEIMAFEKKGYSRSLLESMVMALKMDLTERTQNVADFQEMLKTRSDKSRVMSFLNQPVRLGIGRTSKS